MFESIKNQWSALSDIKRALFMFLIIIFIAAFVYAALWLLKDDYQVLFSDLNAQDASNMVAELERSKTPYKLADNGSSILVKQDSVYKTRLKLVGKGLNLNGSVGFELFNNSEFGMTEFAQKVNYLRALQGELQRTIMGFEEIKSARVHLVLPESGLFKRKDAVPKASVSVAVKHNAQLSSDQVAGIQKLVAASVPEVTMQEVTVVDQRGLALTKHFVSAENEAFVSQRLEVKKELESYMTEKLVSVLDRVVGTGKAIVTVDISLNYDQVKITKEEIMPLASTKGQVVGAISRKRTTHQVDHQGNMQVDGLEPLSKPMPSKASTSEVDYINNRKVEQVLSSPGAINKLTVGVLVPNVNDANKLTKIKELVNMTAGINLERGDGVVVHDIELPNLAEAAINPNQEAVQHTAKLESPSAKGVQQNATPINTTKQPYAWLANPQYFVFYGALFFMLLYLLFRTKRITASTKNLQSREKLLDEINVWAQNRHVTEA